MTPRADAGDIVDQEPVPIGPDDTAADVQTRVCAAAVTVLGRQLDALVAGTAPRRPQDATRASTFGRRRPADGAFEWTRSARNIHDLVRAVSHPYPGAFTTLGGRRLFVWRTRAGDWSANGTPPGEMRVIDDRLYVACGDGRWLEIVRAQLEGEPERDGAELARRLAPGPSRSIPAP
jgi:methionyl-tRNA formyltransferase